MLNMNWMIEKHEKKNKKTSSHSVTVQNAKLTHKKHTVVVMNDK